VLTGRYCHLLLAPDVESEKNPPPSADIKPELDTAVMKGIFQRVVCPFSTPSKHLNPIDIHMHDQNMAYPSEIRVFLKTFLFTYSCSSTYNIYDVDFWRSIAPQKTYMIFPLQTFAYCIR
jgi:hypothetical protein